MLSRLLAYLRWAMSLLLPTTATSGICMPLSTRQQQVYYDKFILAHHFTRLTFQDDEMLEKITNVCETVSVSDRVHHQKEVRHVGGKVKSLNVQGNRRGGVENLKEDRVAVHHHFVLVSGV